MPGSDDEYNPNRDEQPVQKASSCRRKSKYDLETLDAAKALITGQSLPEPQEASNGIKPKRIRGAGPASPQMGSVSTSFNRSNGTGLS